MCVITLTNYHPLRIYPKNMSNAKSAFQPKIKTKFFNLIDDLTSIFAKKLHLYLMICLGKKRFETKNYFYPNTIQKFIISVALLMEFINRFEKIVGVNLLDTFSYAN